MFPRGKKSFKDITLLTLTTILLKNCKYILLDYFLICQHLTKLTSDLKTIGFSIMLDFKVVVVKFHIYGKKSADDPDLRFHTFSLFGQIGPALVSQSLTRGHEFHKFGTGLHVPHNHAHSFFPT